MRLWAGFLVALLGLGALATIGACSDSTDKTGSAGASGSGASAGSGGNSSSAGTTSQAGGSSVAGTGAGGSAACSFATTTCQTCFSSKCPAQALACTQDTACADALRVLPNCACNPANDPTDCQAAFATDGGDKALQLAECYTLNCDTVCQ